MRPVSKFPGAFLAVQRYNRSPFLTVEHPMNLTKSRPREMKESPSNPNFENFRRPKMTKNSSKSIQIYLKNFFFIALDFFTKLASDE